MRLGGPVFGEQKSPEEWVKAVTALGYSAAYCPVGKDASDAEVRAYQDAARAAGIVIAEVGAWGNNPISPDDSLRRAGIAGCQEQLALADRIGARCCVNVAGSRGKEWAGPHPDNLAEETFDLVVDSVRAIIDGVKPTRTSYALETMPWAFPDSVESYATLIRAVARERFAVHCDPANLISSPQRYFATGDLVREFVSRLGPHIRSCHAKDILLREGLTVHLDEVRPGLGALDYGTYLRELSRLDPDTPLMLEHLRTAEEYRLAAEHIRSVAAEVGLSFR
jgi:sugar phosphate isomerase/epimerase